MSSLFDVEKQLVFYGAYHNNKINILIHVIFVPILLWTGQVVLATSPSLPFLPEYNLVFNEYARFELNNIVSLFTAIYLVYYYFLLPSAALLYTPQLLLSLGTATAFAQSPSHLQTALVIHGFSWIAQFVGHGVAEKRAPALLDNLLGAIVLAPFFVHLEILFQFGLFSDLHRNIVNGVGKKILEFRTEEAKKKKAN